MLCSDVLMLLLWLPYWKCTWRKTEWKSLLNLEHAPLWFSWRKKKEVSLSKLIISSYFVFKKQEHVCQNIIYLILLKILYFFSKHCMQIWQVRNSENFVINAINEILNLWKFTVKVVYTIAARKEAYPTFGITV